MINNNPEHVLKMDYGKELEKRLVMRSLEVILTGGLNIVTVK